MYKLFNYSHLSYTGISGLEVQQQKRALISYITKSQIQLNFTDISRNNNDYSDSNLISNES